jgi:hypothetical protein
MFCNERGERSREDTFAKWISKALGGVAPFYSDGVTMEPDGTLREDKTGTHGSLSNRKAEDVCKPCNTSWMSRLQTSAIPILRSMIVSGTPAKLWPDAQAVIAAWAAMTAMTYDATYTNRFLVDEVAHTFYRDRRPPKFSRVRLGRFVPPSTGVAVWHARRHWNIRRASSEPVLGQAVEVTLVLKHLLVQTIINHSQQIPIGLAGQSEDAHLQTCWPITGRLDWPPGKDVTVQDLPRFL